MSAGLDERARIAHHVVVPDLVVDVRPGASSGRSEPAAKASESGLTIASKVADALTGDGLRDALLASDEMDRLRSAARL